MLSDTPPVQGLLLCRLVEVTDLRRQLRFLERSAFSLLATRHSRRLLGRVIFARLVPFEQVGRYLIAFGGHDNGRLHGLLLVKVLDFREQNALHGPRWNSSRVAEDQSVVLGISRGFRGQVQHLGRAVLS